MAFITQKDLGKIGYFNEEPFVPPNRPRSEGLIKSYNSSIDTRAWSSNNRFRATYLLNAIKRLNDVPFINNIFSFL